MRCLLFSLLWLVFLPIPSRAQSAQNLHDQGLDKLNQKRYQEALALFDKAIAKEKDHFESFYDRGKTKLAMGKAEESVADFSQTLKLNKDYFQAALWRAKAQEALGRNEAALDDYSLAMKINPANTESPAAKGWLLARMARYTEAMEVINKALTMGAKSPNLFLGKALVLQNQKKLNEAIAECNKAIENAKNEPQPYLFRAKLKMEGNQNQAAIPDLTKAIELKLPGEEAHVLRAEAYLKTGQADAALADVQNLIEVQKSKNKNLLLMKARAYFLKNDFGAAAREYGKAISTDNRNATLFLERGKCLYLSGKTKFTQASADFAKALELDPKMEEAAFGAGRIAFETGKYALGIQWLTKALEIKPSADVYYLRSKCHYKMKQKAECCADLKKSAQMGNAEAERDMAEVCR